jgi:hypothetical protein
MVSEAGDPRFFGMFPRFQETEAKRRLIARQVSDEQETPSGRPKTEVDVF